MYYLLIASIIWAFSFGLIKHVLVSPGLDPFFIAAVRLLLSLLVFLPFLRAARIHRKMRLYLILVGAVQYGLMYVCYLLSYDYLPAYLVALATILTPLYVTILNDVFGRRFRIVFLGAAVMAVAGTAVVVTATPDKEGVLVGLLLVQASNLCFAFGQIMYRRLMGRIDLVGAAGDRDVFGLLYMGGTLIALLAGAFFGELPSAMISGRQVLTLLYLGVVPSGICFFLWNVGARRTNAGTLAVFNNAKIPLAVFFALLLFGEQTNLSRLLCGGVMMLVAVAITEAWGRAHPEGEEGHKREG